MQRTFQGAMADDDKHKSKPKIVEAVGRASGTSSAHARAIAVANLPDLTPEECTEFYQTWQKELKSTRLRGYYGVIEGSDESDDVTLFMYSDNKMHPVLKLVMQKADLIDFADALQELIAARFRNG